MAVVILITRKKYIYQKLKQEILNGTIPLGERLIEKDLTEKFNSGMERY